MAVVVAELWLAVSWTNRLGQSTSSQASAPPIPNVGTYYLITAVR
jgi:hypothetical protein